MKHVGRPRRITDEQWRAVMSWSAERADKTLTALCRELGLSTTMAWLLRNGYQFKKKSP
jgi:transposase